MRTGTVTVMLVASQVAPGKPEILHYPDVPHDERRRLHGVGTHTAIDRLTVGEQTEVVFEWTVGAWEVETGGELLVVWRWPFDWSDLQSGDPAGNGFIEVVHNPSGDSDGAGVELIPRYNWIAGIEPWHHQLQIRVTSGRLRTGDRVQVTCRRWRAPTCAAERCRFLMLIDHRGNGTRSRLVQEPDFRIVAGPLVRLAAIVDSDGVTGQPIELIVRGEDEWGNASRLDAVPKITIEGDDARKSTITPAQEDPTARAQRFLATVAQSGPIRFRVTSNGFQTLTNVCEVRAEHPPLTLFWGDLHSGQTEIGCGNGSIGDSYAFGRDCAGLKFMTHQANDHYVTADDWRETRRVTDEFYQPGRFAPILGCEWSPLTKDGGDRNVYYNYDEPVLRRSDRFFRESDPDPAPDVPTAPDFHAAFRDKDVLVNIHVGGRMTNLEWYEQKIEKLCETHSTHGTVEWFFMDALKRGCRVGLTAGTDGVMCRPGADHPGRRLIRNLRNGLTAVYARELTREAIWDALQNRRCYATTGARIRLWFEVDGQPMGSEWTTKGAPRIRLHVQGTAPIERVDLFRGVEVIESWRVSPPRKSEGGSTAALRVLWGGTERKGTARLQRVDWTGSLTADNGTLELLDTINFQSIADVARSSSERKIEWNSQTAGNAAGVLIRVTGDSATELTFKTGPAQFKTQLEKVRAKEMFVDAGGVRRFVKLGPPPAADGPTEFRMETVDHDNVTGDFIPYWIRVTQIDQSLAWSSPVYVTRHR